MLSIIWRLKNWRNFRGRLRPGPRKLRTSASLPWQVLNGRVGLNLSGTSVWRPQSRYTVSRIECRIKFPQSQRCRTKIALHPPKSCAAPFSGPPCRTFLSFAAGRVQGGCRSGLEEGIAVLSGSEKGSRYRGVSQLQSHQLRYSVQLRPKPQRAQTRTRDTSLLHIRS